VSYTALYRKFRPDNFSDVKGQDAIVTTLKNQLSAGRIGHAYLFTGTRGTGKTSVAKILAKAVNCENPTKDGPCGECRMCRAITAGASMNVIEIDAASNNGVDNIRNIVEEVSYSPAEGNFKVYIIDEVHMLSIGAFNALLKTLEEPPSYCIFILATTEVHKIPITILSRCQRYDFKRITIVELVARMSELIDIEKVQVEDKALRYIARLADGAMRDALSLLDQCIAYHLGAALTYDKVLDVLGAVDTAVFSRLLRHVLARDVAGCMELVEEIVMQGRELVQFVTEYTWYLRNLMLILSSDQLEDVIDMSAENLARLKEEASQTSPDQIIRYIRIFSELSGQIRYASQKRILLEISLIKLCNPSMEANTDTLTDRIRAIEDKLEKGTLLQGMSGAGAGSGTAHTGDTAGIKEAGILPSPKPTLPKAIPADIKQIVSKWPSIVNNMTSPMMKHYLKAAKLSLVGDGQLMVALQSGLGFDYFLEKPENREILESILSEIAGKEITVHFQELRDERDFEDNYINLSEFIHMEIEEEP
jgi:DNA polymerase-3 subunit gamma/tau